MRQHLGLARRCRGRRSPLSINPGNISLASRDVPCSWAVPPQHLLGEKVLMLQPSLIFTPRGEQSRTGYRCRSSGARWVNGGRIPAHGGCSDTGVRKGALLRVGVMPEQGR